MSIEFNENHLREITENSDRSKSNSARISDLEDDVKAIKEENKAIHDIATVKETQADLTEQVSTLKEEPARTKAQWVDKAIGAVCGAVGMAILGYVLNNLTNIFS